MRMRAGGLPSSGHRKRDVGAAIMRLALPMIRVVFMSKAAGAADPNIDLNTAQFVVRPLSARA